MFGLQEMNNQLKIKLEIARDAIQVKQEEQEKIFNQLKLVLNLSNDDDIDFVFDYCFNNTEWNTTLDKITR